jgi:hypothetical protein
MSVGFRSTTKQWAIGGTCLARIALLRLESRLHPADTLSVMLPETDLTAFQEELRKLLARTRRA